MKQNHPDFDEISFCWLLLVPEAVSLLFDVFFATRSPLMEMEL